jgi:hypothetical protein
MWAVSWCSAAIDAGNVPEEILRRSGFRQRTFGGRPFRGERLVAVKRKLVGYYEDHGFPFAEVRLTDLTIANDSVSAALFLVKNQEFRIDSIVVKGKSKIRENYLRNYLGIKRKERYNESKVSEISTRLREIPFVTETDKPQVLFNEENASIYVFLDKKRASQFDGILGILPDNANPGEVLITGEITLKLLSALNRGELIDIQWRKMQARTQNLNIHLTYPFLFNTPFGLDGTFELYKRDSLFLNLKGVIGVQYHLVGNDHIKVFADLRSTDILARSTLTNAQTLNPDNVTRARSFTVSAIGCNGWTIASTRAGASTSMPRPVRVTSASFSIRTWARRAMRASKRTACK